jgi:MoaA/NifB/PqqE/SkfB family radical SAM enzyme
LLGGEPVYNKHALDFLDQLVVTRLSHKTKLEITTNGTILNPKLMELLDKSNWKYICVFVSVDAIGPKAEWLRYGCKWETIKQNINHYCDIANYVEVHTTVSILNITDLSAVKKFCQGQKIPQSFNIVSTPEFMDIRNWDGDKFTIDHSNPYADMIGISRKPGTKQELKNYIEQFADRTHLSLVDQPLATAIGILC